MLRNICNLRELCKNTVGTEIPFVNDCGWWRVLLHDVSYSLSESARSAPSSCFVAVGAEGLVAMLVSVERRWLWMSGDWQPGLERWIYSIYLPLIVVCLPLTWHADWCGSYKFHDWWCRLGVGALLES